MIFVTGELLTTFVPVIDCLTALVKTRDENHQHLVNDIIAPYFAELQIAYTAYLGTLRKAKEMVEEGQSFPAVYAEIEALRAGDLIVRDKVREMADAYEGALSSYRDITNFFTDAGHLFGYWNGYHHSGTLRILTALKEGSGVWSHKFLSNSIEMTIHAGEEQWRRLSNQYAHIRVKYLQPAEVTVGRSRNTAPQAQRNQRHRPSSRLLNSIRAFLFPPSM